MYPFPVLKFDGNSLSDLLVFSVFKVPLGCVTPFALVNESARHAIEGSGGFESVSNSHFTSAVGCFQQNYLEVSGTSELSFQSAFLWFLNLYNHLEDLI
ncbi:hypothetical protein DKX38_006421 [Salix brachista]|uniref:Uncharacterized protein n=1 Tax=Salix brachista TaxID=2182728 RepID=A0A5N5N227_9ROSI|nr:hypothetical protein DKX38_006421 [Salix brachista]